MIRQLFIFRNFRDNLLRLIEVKAGRLSNWAWDKRWKTREDWVKGYKEWKK